MRETLRGSSYGYGIKNEVVIINLPRYAILLMFEVSFARALSLQEGTA